MWQPRFDASNKRTRWLFCISGGVYLNLFIFIFEPYSKQVFAYNAPIYYQFVFGGIVTVVFTLTSIVIPHFYPRYFVAPYFTVPRFLTWYFMSGLLCHIPGFFYDNWLTGHVNTWAWFVKYEFLYAIPTLFFISVPFLVVLNFIFMENQNNPTTAIEEIKDVIPNAYEVEAVKVDTKTSNLTIEKEAPQYKNETEGISSDVVFQLRNASGSSVFEIRQAQLVYITSANNYVEIFYINDKKALTKTLLRQTLTEIENQLVTENGAFYRCHKAFIINKEKIIAVKGNAKSYQLILQGVENPIPVSRMKNENLISQYVHLLDA